MSVSYRVSASIWYSECCRGQCRFSYFICTEFYWHIPFLILRDFYQMLFSYKHLYRFRMSRVPSLRFIYGIMLHSSSAVFLVYLNRRINQLNSRVNFTSSISEIKFNFQFQYFIIIFCFFFQYCLVLKLSFSIASDL